MTDFYSFFRSSKATPGTVQRLKEYFEAACFKPTFDLSDERCPVCRHPYRAQIEEMCYHHVPVTVIGEWLQEMGHKPVTKARLTKHITEHCALLKQAQAAAEEKMAARIELKTEEILSASEGLTAVQNAYLEKLGGPDSETKITTTDFIRATKVKHEIDASDKGRKVFERMFAMIEKKADAKVAIVGEVEDALPNEGAESV